MKALEEVSLQNLLMFAFVIVGQILATSLLPRTAGFTSLYWTIACLSVFAVSLWALARILHAGIPISVLIPILAASVPLATLAIGLIFFKETASMSKIVLLSMACVFVGLANLV